MRAILGTARSVVGGFALAGLLALATVAAARAQGGPLSVEDMPLAQHAGVASGGTVTPVYEGWYENPDGTFTIYFGYYNRNTEEVVTIPLGPANRIEGLPGGTDRGQPTRFEPGRHWGVFGVSVPADFGDRRLVWHLEIRGKGFDIPGSMREDWMVPATSGDAMGNLPPTVQLEEDGPRGFGPLGVWVGPRSAEVGEAVHLVVFASDDGTVTSGRPGATARPVSLTWLVHRGGGPVEFSRKSGTVANEGGRFETDVSFGGPGEYVLRVRANDDSGLAPAGNEQCCWTNGFVRFSVTP